MSILTDADETLLPAALREARGFHYATEWYLNWTPLAYQWAWHHLTVPNTTFVAGIATGKTTAVAASYLIDCLSIPYFRAMNASVTIEQAKLPFNMVLAWIETQGKMDHLIESIKTKPFPVIQFKNFSEFSFRTTGNDGSLIRGFEYDRINFDECGLDYRGETPKVLRGRLRGIRPDGSTRMARLDATTSPTGAEWLIERFKRGDPTEIEAQLDLYRSLRVATWDNTALTTQQVEAMKADYPPAMIDVELGGMFPDYGTTLFAPGHVRACIDQSLYDLAYTALNPETGKPKPGYVLEEDPRHGIVHFELPYEPGRIYVMGGDPGVDNYPKRNSPCVMVADVTEKPYKMVYFHWISGRGSYMPFLMSYRYAQSKYTPHLCGIDATGTQKGIDELAFKTQGVRTDGLKFNTDKAAMINTTAIDIANHNWRLPPIKGMISQLGMYTFEDDKDLPQDLVMTLAEISYLAGFIPQSKIKNPNQSRQNFTNRRRRTSHRRRRVRV